MLSLDFRGRRVKPMGFVSELKRRDVFRPAAADAAAWLLVQVGEALFPAFGVPDALFRGMVILHLCRTAGSDT